jgi:hypothetical protein
MVMAENAPATILVVDDEAAVVQSVTALLPRSIRSTW